MRNKLKKIGKEHRHIFTGEFSRFGLKNGYMGQQKTILLVNIKDEEGNIVTDHLWFNDTKGFQKINLKQGDIVKFSARVSRYEKGYKGYRKDIYLPITYDYKLSYPTNIERVSVKNQ